LKLNLIQSSSNYFFRAFQILAGGRLPCNKLITKIPLLEAKEIILNKMPETVKVVIEMQ
jgi:hypothetical protein